MLYEERYTTTGVRLGRRYLEHCREKILPALRAGGGRVLCLTSGLIGDPDSSFLQMTAFEDMAAWQGARDIYATGREGLVESEEVRLLRPVASLPTGDEVAVENRRASYGYRRFFIEPDSLDDFVRCSEDGVWPWYHAAGCRILGLWTPLAGTEPQEIVLMTGYDGPGHWEETRFFGGKPESIDEALWTRGRKLGAERHALLVGNTAVRLFRAHPIDDSGWPGLSDNTPRS